MLIYLQNNIDSSQTHVLTVYINKTKKEPMDSPWVPNLPIDGGYPGAGDSSCLFQGQSYAN